MFMYRYGEMEAADFEVVVVFVESVVAVEFSVVELAMVEVLLTTRVDVEVDVLVAWGVVVE